jgi:hypothetical protein
MPHSPTLLASVVPEASSVPEPETGDSQIESLAVACENSSFGMNPFFRIPYQPLRLVVFVQWYLTPLIFGCSCDARYTENPAKCPAIRRLDCNEKTIDMAELAFAQLYGHNIEQVLLRNYK